MTDLLWPGDARAGALGDDASFLSAMIQVESAWLSSLQTYGMSPATERDLHHLAGPADLPLLARESEAGGNPVIPLLSLLRSRLADDPAAPWLHKGLTSQDVLDTALVLLLRDAVERVGADLDSQITTLATLADRHRATPMAGRTLTQHAVPITFGLKAGAWLRGLLDARDLLATLTFPIQIGGAAGSLAAIEALASSRPPSPAGPSGSPGDLSGVLVAATADALGLAVADPWHTARSPLTRLADALVTCTDAWGRIAADVLTLSRPEIAELAERTGGGSSTMPNKQNPVLSVLIRRAALAAPPLAATLHTAASLHVDERPDGAWHVEWPTLRTLARRTVVAGAQTADLLSGLRADTSRMARTLDEARPGIDAEQHKMGADGPYRGATDRIIDALLHRAAEKPC